MIKLCTLWIELWDWLLGHKPKHGFLLLICLAKGNSSSTIKHAVHVRQILVLVVIVLTFLFTKGEIRDADKTIKNYVLIAGERNLRQLYSKSQVQSGFY